MRVLLLLSGLLFFREHLSASNILGLAFCVIGLLLVAR